MHVCVCARARVCVCVPEIGKVVEVDSVGSLLELVSGGGKAEVCAPTPTPCALTHAFHSSCTPHTYTAPYALRPAANHACFPGGRRTGILNAACGWWRVVCVRACVCVCVCVVTRKWLASEGAGHSR